MSNKIINATLTKNNQKEIVIRFNIESNTYDLNLQSNNSEEIKKVFLKLSEQIRMNPIEIELDVDNEEIDEKTDNLFIEASYEYIKQLNEEMLILENDDDLKVIRQFTNNTTSENLFK